MVLDLIVKDLQKLFSEKKYDQVIKKSEELFSEKERPSFLLNIIGAAKMLKSNRNYDDITSALKNFENAYLKDKKSVHGFLGISNLISTVLQEHKNYSFFDTEINRVIELYLDAENYHVKNDKFLKAGYNLFVHLLDHNKIKQICRQILKFHNDNNLLLSNCIFSQLYYYDWDQEKYFNNTLLHSKTFKNFEINNFDHVQSTNNGKINLGFISSDFRLDHSVTFYIKNTLKYLDKKKFNIFLFSLSKRDSSDKCQNELVMLADYWIDAEHLKNSDVINLIKENKISILVDVMGLTKNSRIEIFKSRVAPIQVSWLAYCNTLGFENVDYLISDSNLIYPEEEKFYQEKILKMPDIWNSHSGFDFDSKYRDPPFLKSEVFTFGSFNNARKISDETIYVWSEILNNLPNVRLIIKSSIRYDYRVLINKFKNYGVEKKIQILDRRNFNKEAHLDFYKNIDVALDTFPYNGVTTTFESLWMNVPVIVLKGFNFNSRCGESIIKNSGINYLISENKNDYISKALELATKKNKLIELKKDLLKTISTSPLYDTQKFAKNFGQILIQIYQKFSEINKK